MTLKNYIKVYDNVIPLTCVSSILKTYNEKHFNAAGVLSPNGEGTVNKDIRDTYDYPLFQDSESLTDVHWCNLLASTFTNAIKKYTKELNILDCPWFSFSDIAILKYENKGFYKYHVDHATTAPRTFSCILLLNDDYEGGRLCFRNPDGSEEMEIESKSARLIVWPSNFLYPHTVKPVTKGTRYSVVGWAL